MSIMGPQSSLFLMVVSALLAGAPAAARAHGSLAEARGRRPHAAPLEMNDSWFHIGLPKVRNKAQEDGSHWIKWKRSLEPLDQVETVHDLRKGGEETAADTNTQPGVILNNAPPSFKNEDEPILKFLNALKLRAKTMTENKNNIDSAVVDVANVADGTGANIGNGASANADYGSSVDFGDLAVAIPNENIRDIVSNSDGTVTYSANNGNNVILLADDTIFWTGEDSGSVNDEMSASVKDDNGPIINYGDRAIIIEDNSDILNSGKSTIINDSNGVIFRDADGTSDSDSILFNDGAVVPDETAFSNGVSRGVVSRNGVFFTEDIIDSDGTPVQDTAVISNIDIGSVSAPDAEEQHDFKYFVQSLNPIGLSNITVRVDDPDSMPESFIRKVLNIFSPFQNEKVAENHDSESSSVQDMNQFLQYQYVLTISIYMLGWVFVTLSIIGIVTFLRREPKDGLNEGPHEVGYI